MYFADVFLITELILALGFVFPFFLRMVECVFFLTHRLLSILGTFEFRAAQRALYIAAMLGYPQL